MFLETHNVVVSKAIRNVKKKTSSISKLNPLQNQRAVIMKQPHHIVFVVISFNVFACGKIIIEELQDN